MIDRSYSNFQLKNKMRILRELGVLFFFICLLINNTLFANETVKSKADINKEIMAQKVKNEFLHAWNGYKEYAWGHDDLKPLSKGYHDWYDKPLLMTPVDAFSTMKIMGLEKEAEKTKDLILKNLSFDKDLDVKFFEINIRLLGGLLSAYQLDGDKGFLILAEDLAKRLLPAFESPTGMPYAYVNLKTGKTKDLLSNPAEIGTLLLEWGTLSKITGNPVYYQKAKNAVEVLFAKRSKLGLVGTIINIESGKWENNESHLGARIDSYYEYLLKGWLMFSDPDLKRMWDKSINAVNKYLTANAGNGLWYGRVNMNTGKITATRFGALEAFFPAVLALSGDMKRAGKLQQSCYKMWRLYDIEPEAINFTSMKILSEPYVLRPENIESAYYLYYFTQDPQYLKMGITYFNSLVKYCRTEIGYSHLKSVISKEKEDSMQSFFLAETLKYLYLLFAPRETFDFSKWIFNTEAHPLRIWEKSPK